MSILKDIRQRMPPGTVLKTPSGKSEFKISEISSNKVEVEVGKGKTKISIPPECFENVSEVLGEERWIKIGAAHETPEIGSFDRYVQEFTNGLSAASYVAPILEKAGIAEIDRRRPAKIRLRGSFSA